MSSHSQFICFYLYICIHIFFSSYCQFFLFFYYMLFLTNFTSLLMFSWIICREIFISYIQWLKTMYIHIRAPVISQVNFFCRSPWSFSFCPKIHTMTKSFYFPFVYNMAFFEILHNDVNLKFWKNFNLIQNFPLYKKGIGGFFHKNIPLTVICS